VFEKIILGVSTLFLICQRPGRTVNGEQGKNAKEGHHNPDYHISFRIFEISDHGVEVKEVLQFF
jgi:hypothetical protein